MDESKIEVTFDKPAEYTLTCAEGKNGPASRGSITQLQPAILCKDIFEQKFEGKMAFTKRIRQGVSQTRTVIVYGATPKEVVDQLQVEHDHYYRE